MSAFESKPIRQIPLHKLANIRGVGHQPTFVERVCSTPIDGGGEQYKVARAQVDAHNHYGRTVYHSIEPFLAPAFSAIVEHAVFPSENAIGNDLLEGWIVFGFRSGQEQKRRWIEE